MSLNPFAAISSAHLLGEISRIEGATAAGDFTICLHGHSGKGATRAMADAINRRLDRADRTSRRGAAPAVKPGSTAHQQRRASNFGRAA